MSTEIVLHPSSSVQPRPTTNQTGPSAPTLTGQALIDAIARFLLADIREKLGTEAAVQIGGALLAARKEIYTQPVGTTTAQTACLDLVGQFTKQTISL